MSISHILIAIEKSGTKIKKTNAYLNFDLKWVNVTLLLHFFENHPYEASLGRGNESLYKWSRSHDQDGHHGYK